MSDNPKRPVAVLLTSNWISMLGVAFATTAGFSWLFALPIQLRGRTAHQQPVHRYCRLHFDSDHPRGRPAIDRARDFLARRRIERAEERLTTTDRRAAIRKLAIFFAIMTTINILIGTQGTYRAVSYMETNQFCGQSCHVTIPEFTAHQNSPQARVVCTDCHVAPGAAGWFESKMAGTHQFIDVVFNRYHRPIESAIASNRLVPFRLTCEQCHWPEKLTPSSCA